ncbi:unnamed protein product [Closterium sp. NIES-64]|nr:unnamed protein product [Closterium sp. NIES-64]
MATPSCDRADDLSLFDLTSGASPAPAADADPAVRSKWATRDAAARLAVRRHLPTSERAHFSQYKSAQTLYDAVVARYSSLPLPALSRLMLPYLFPDLSAFPTVADLITHLRTSDTRYRAALPAEFCAKNPPPMYIALYYVVARLPDSLRVVRDHFLAVWVLSFPLAALCASAAAADLPGLESVGAGLPLVGDVAPARARGARAADGAGRGSGGAVAVWRRWRRREWGVAAGLVAGVVVVVGGQQRRRDGGGVPAVVVEAAAEVEAAEVEAVEAAAEEAVVVEEVELVGVVPSSVAARGGWPALAPAAAAALAGHPFASAASAGVAIFDLDFDAILTAMYVVDYSEENEGYRCFQPDPGIGTAALGDYRTTLSRHPSPRPVAVSLADPSGGPVLSHFSTVLPCPAAPSGTLSGLYLPSFSTNLVSGADCRWAASGQVLAAASRSGPESAPCSCRLLSHETLLWHHVLATPPCPVFGAWLPVSLSLVFPSLSLLSPPGQDLPVSPVSRVASGLLLTPPTSPRQRLPCRRFTWMCGAQPRPWAGFERYFLLVVDELLALHHSLPCASKGAVTEVLIDWIASARLQLRKSFGSDLPVLLSAL